MARFDVKLGRKRMARFIGGLAVAVTLAGTVVTGAGSAAAVTYSYTIGPRIELAKNAELRGIAVDSVSHLVYSADYSNNRVLVSDETSNSIVATIATPGGPVSIGIDPFLHRAYVSLLYGNGVVFIDTSTNTVIGQVPVDNVHGPLAVDPVTHTVFVDHGNLRVARVDGITGAATGELKVPNNVNAMAVDSAENRVVVTGYGLVGIYDETTLQLLATVPLGSGSPADDVAVDNSSHTAFVASGNDFVSVVDTHDFTQTDVHLPIGYDPSYNNYQIRRVAVDTSSHTAYLSDGGYGNVFAVDGPSRTLLSTFPRRPVVLTSLGVDASTHRVYLNNQTDRTIDYYAREEDPVATAVTPVSGGGQTAETGSAFATPLVAAVSDQNGAAFNGAIVTFSVSAGSATFPGGQGSAQVVSGPDGRATAPTLSAGDSPGPVTVDATVAGASTSATFTETVTAAPLPPMASTPVPDAFSTGYQAKQVTTFTASPVSTKSGGELIVAMVQAGASGLQNQDVTQVSGGGLDWSQAGAITAPGRGAVEIWQAYTNSKLTKVAVRARLAFAADAAITVRTFSNAAMSLGAVFGVSNTHGPTARTDISPQASGSLVVAAGLDISSATKPKAAKAQPLTSYFLNSPAHDASWTQAVRDTTTAGSTVSVRAGIPANDAWSLLGAEVPGAPTANSPS